MLSLMPEFKSVFIKYASFGVVQIFAYLAAEITLQIFSLFEA
jgi:hypothetical protein